MIEIILKGNEGVKEGLATLVAGEVERIAKTVTREGEWTQDDAAIVLNALAKKGLKKGESLEDAILRGVHARVGAHTAPEVSAESLVQHSRSWEEKRPN
jgi:hypothetical protein